MSIERHSRARQIELARSIAERKKIYLDMRFWIILRDTAIGIRTAPEDRKLLHHVRRGVANGQIVCPISASMFLELMKQPNTVDRRIGTVALIDELSLGISMIPSPTLMGTEIYSFLSRARGTPGLLPIQDLVWTKVAYVMGDAYPSPSGLSPQDVLTVQKASFDYLWNLSLAEIISTIGDDLPPPDRFAELSREANTKNAAHKNDLDSYLQTYDIELRGVIEIAGDVAADVVYDLSEKEAGRKTTPSPEERAISVNMCRNLLYHALKKTEARGELRSLHIGASIHAAMRWDKARKFKPNDYYDFQHATAAVSYCDAFFTEGPLRELLTQPQVNLEAVNGCRIISNIQAAGLYIKEISASR